MPESLSIENFLDTDLAEDCFRLQTFLRKDFADKARAMWSQIDATPDGEWHDRLVKQYYDLYDQIEKIDSYFLSLNL